MYTGIDVFMKQKRNVNIKIKQYQSKPRQEIPYYLKLKTHLG
jgi:hypothetical protein